MAFGFPFCCFRTFQSFTTEITVHSSLITIHALAFSSVSFVVKSDSATTFQR